MTHLREQGGASQSLGKLGKEKQILKGEHTQQKSTIPTGGAGVWEAAVAPDRQTCSFDMSCQERLTRSTFCSQTKSQGSSESQINQSGPWHRNGGLA